MHRLVIDATKDVAGRGWHISGSRDGLDQIAAYAKSLAAELKVDDFVYFEIFWPWETEETNTWDAVRVDLKKLENWDDASHPTNEEEDKQWWVETLPPYAELTQEQRDALGIEGEYA